MPSSKPSVNQDNPFKILLVDDDSSFTYMLKVGLELQTDYQVIVENDPESALQTALRVRPNLIFLDAIMPKKDGSEVLKQLSENPDTNPIPVVFLTAISYENHSPSTRTNGKLLRESIRKPVSLQTLKEVIVRHLDSQ